MAKWMTLSEVLQIWRREFERESYGDSQAQSMGVAIDMYTLFSVWRSNCTAHSPCTACSANRPVAGKIVNKHICKVLSNKRSTHHNVMDPDIDWSRLCSGSRLCRTEARAVNAT
ncbi:hypothetical protein ANANG_G00050850 [Anguilla anguilla]|uniref:Uncharacterized protein n=1 Tax=Anguilla anguilla TaxID=7936 RepID=A0A9D3MVS4_ANGAN|nr:hypothetical protein ANANG_G00050850 [Anguilla anguilla]